MPEQRHPFPDLPVNTTTHLRLWLHAAILQVGAYVDIVGGEDGIHQFGFLHGYLTEAARYLPSAELPVDQAAGSWLKLLAHWEKALPAQADTWPLRRLTTIGLGYEHLLAMMLVALVEVDSRFGSLYAALHPFPDERRMTVGLLDDILKVDEPLIHTRKWALPQQLADFGLMMQHGREKPRAAQALSIPSAVWNGIDDERPQHPAQHTTLFESDTFLPLDALEATFPPDLLARLGRLPDLLSQELVGGLVVRGMAGSGRLRAVGALARVIHRSILLVDCPSVELLPSLWRQAGPLATLFAAIPLLQMELAPGETVEVPALAGYVGPIGLLLRQEGSVQGPVAERCVSLQIPPPDQAVRQHYWLRSLSGRSTPHKTTVVKEISERFHLTLGGIEKAAPLTQVYSALEGRKQIQIEDAQAACSTINRQSLDALATHIDVRNHRWQDLVVSNNTQAELADLLMRCRHREAVLSQLSDGFGARNRGVRALMAGPSGTGKTLAARILAGMLKLDLYRVDLAAVVNKYVGETERNLSRLFARAEEQDVILLLDEGDSLMTGRTDVRSSNDRYANMETNYLLQRLENYEGIILVTTNVASRIDSAFQRRMDSVIEFSLPESEERYRIWQLHLPASHTVDAHFLGSIAARCNLTGGQIRNAALHAAVLAVEHQEPIQATFIAAAISREYQKMGSASPLIPELAIQNGSSRTQTAHKQNSAPVRL